MDAVLVSTPLTPGYVALFFDSQDASGGKPHRLQIVWWLQERQGDEVVG